MSKQKTLKGSFSLCGKGLHTGLSLTVTFNPAPENTGYKIQRIDLEGEPVILWIDTDDGWQYRDFGEGDYPFVVDSYFGNYALWSTPTRLLTSVETRGDSSDDGWWRLYWNIGAIY